jgi:hypothetical protein
VQVPHNLNPSFQLEVVVVVVVVDVVVFWPVLKVSFYVVPKAFSSSFWFFEAISFSSVVVLTDVLTKIKTIWFPSGILPHNRTRVWPDWAFEFPNQTGPDTQICWKVRRPERKMSGLRTVRILKICRTSGLDVMSGRAAQQHYGNFILSKQFNQWQHGIAMLTGTLYFYWLKGN